MLAEWRSAAPAYQISEPQPELRAASAIGQAGQAPGPGAGDADADANAPQGLVYARRFTGRAQVFEDNIDTDAIIPAEFMPGKCPLPLAPCPWPLAPSGKPSRPRQLFLY
jgi:hypothetical protein